MKITKFLNAIYGNEGFEHGAAWHLGKQPVGFVIMRPKDLSTMRRRGSSALAEAHAMKKHMAMSSDVGLIEKRETSLSNVADLLEKTTQLIHTTGCLYNLTSYNLLHPGPSRAQPRRKPPYPAPIVQHMLTLAWYTHLPRLHQGQIVCCAAAWRCSFARWCIGGLRNMRVYLLKYMCKYTYVYKYGLDISLEVGNLTEAPFIMFTRSGSRGLMQGAFFRALT